MCSLAWRLEDGNYLNVHSRAHPSFAVSNTAFTVLDLRWLKCLPKWKWKWQMAMLSAREYNELIYLIRNNALDKIQMQFIRISLNHVYDRMQLSGAMTQIFVPRLFFNDIHPHQNVILCNSKFVENVLKCAYSYGRYLRHYFIYSPEIYRN